ncbi:MAG: sulfotransferase [Anaerolineales bacterium]|nr:sulfotransferase [Anaerolineales bacterium]
MLSKILNSHPQISFHGETDFLTPRLWNEIWENRFWFHWEIHANSNPSSAISRKDNSTFLNLRREVDTIIPDELLNEVRKKAAKSIQKTIRTLLEPKKKNPLVWGFKDPWNGSSNFYYDWKAYDFVFPKAIWIHLVRNPFTYAKSSSMWNRTPLDITTLTHTLREWVNIVKFSRTRADTGLFFEIKYESLIKSPSDTLSNIFASCGVKWDEVCLNPLKTSIMKSSQEINGAIYSELSKDHIHDICSNISGFREICTELDYDLTSSFPDYFCEFYTSSNPSSNILEPLLHIQDLQTEIDRKNLFLQNLEDRFHSLQTQLQATQTQLQTTQTELAYYRTSRLIQLVRRLAGV